MADQKLTQLGAEATPTDDDIMYLVDDPGGVGIGPTSKKLVLSTLFNPLPGTLTLANAGLHLLDTGGDHDLIISPGTDLGADRVLTITTGDAARTITLSGNPTLSDWFDQSVKQGASPTWEDVYVTDGGNVGIAGNELLTFNAAANNAIFSGCSVGIGTAPDNTLHAFNETAIGSADITQYPLKIEAKDAGGDFWNRQGVGIQLENTASSGSFISAEIVGTVTNTTGTEGTLLLRTRQGGTMGTRVMVLNSGDVGIGTTPQGLLHGYDTIGGFIYWEYDGVDGTARTVIPNGAGDVVYSLSGLSNVRSSDSTLTAGTITATAPAASFLIAVGLTLAVAADGSVTVQRTAGVLTYKVALWLLWL